MTALPVSPTPLVPFFVALIIGVLALTLPFLWRVVVGPTPYDRLVGLNAIGTFVPALFVLTGLAYGRLDMLVDAALAVFLLNLFTTLIVARHAARRPLEGEPRDGDQPGGAA